MPVIDSSRIGLGERLGSPAHLRLWAASSYLEWSQVLDRPRRFLVGCKQDRRVVSRPSELAQGGGRRSHSPDGKSSNENEAAEPSWRTRA
jgi:hypothetical protein